jgi:hypothetical protein
MVQYYTPILYEVQPLVALNMRVCCIPAVSLLWPSGYLLRGMLLSCFMYLALNKSYLFRVRIVLAVGIDTYAMGIVSK